MKKTFTILTAIALAGTALAVDSPYSTEIVQFTAVDAGLTEIKMPANGKNGQATGGVYVDTTEIGKSGVSLKLTGSEGDTNSFMTEYNPKSWSNADAISLLNWELGTSLTATNIIDAKFVNTGGSGTNIRELTVSFANTSVYSAGDTVVMYLAVSGKEGAPTSVSVAGLLNASVTYAQDGKEGFADAISGASAQNLILVRIAGNLTGDADAIDNVVFTLNGGNKVGYGMFAIVPEPATATLSLLALAGLAARRRRK